MADALCLIDEFLLQFFVDLVAEGNLGEVELDEVAEDVGLDGERPPAEEFIRLVVLIVEHLHLFREGLLL